MDTWPLVLSLCAVPASIAIAELFLSIALLLRLTAMARGREIVSLPRIFRYWMIWVGLEVFAWLRSPNPRMGLGEVRHLFLIASLFIVMPALRSFADRALVWRGIVAVASISSAVLIAHFFGQLLFYHGSLDPVVYLRGGGLVNHWMIYATIEIFVFAALLELWEFFPTERRWLVPVTVINSVAILLSLTRMLWITCLLLLMLHLLWSRSQWFWAVPAVSCLLVALAPGPVRSRIVDSSHLEYYANAERLQMLRVGLAMVRQNPLTGVGPGRVNELYTHYLSAEDPIPSYHGHLHNNVVQIAAESGLPVLFAALMTVGVIFCDLKRRYKLCISADEKFLCRTCLLGLAGFIVEGMFDYTYGHSLGLILVSFAVLSSLSPVRDPPGKYLVEEGREIN